ncbi:MAG: HAD-IA family hydrolase [Thermodesulfobacteriota bacterium]
MKFKNIKAVFFDAADTLFYIKEGLGKTYSFPAKKYGIEASPEEIKKSFSRHFSSAPPLAFGDVTDKERKTLEKKWWYEIVKNVYNDVGMFSDFDSYFEELYEIFRAGAWEIFPDTKYVLSYLKEKNYKIIVVSNFDSRVYDVCENLEIYDYFDDFIISSEAGFAKPDIEIFQYALEKNSLNPFECIHIGDNYLNDYISPTSLGINAVFLDREKKYHLVENLKTIQNLTEITEFL